MKTSKRIIFLKNFLKLFGADRIKITMTDNDKIYGTIVYSDSESQDFCLHMTEDNVPSDDMIELIRVIQNNNLVDIDKIIVSPNDLFEKTGWKDYEKFKIVLNELFDIEVKLIDDSKETDSFFIHN